ncbi:DNA-binding protein [Streptomyces sp. NPDC002795]|uniref:DNA-binding protein n=1 Tax=Streptomyces sp. NPDC002795 TaxID=3364665 RepID=UPI0036C7A08D
MPAKQYEMSRDDLLALPPLLSVEAAGRALGLGKTKAYALIRSGDFPTPVLKLGETTKVPTEPLLRLLGLARA